MLWILFLHEHAKISLFMVKRKWNFIAKMKHDIKATTTPTPTTIESSRIGSMAHLSKVALLCLKKIKVVNWSVCVISTDKIDLLWIEFNGQFNLCLPFHSVYATWYVTYITIVNHIITISSAFKQLFSLCTNKLHCSIIVWICDCESKV